MSEITQEEWNAKVNRLAEAIEGIAEICEGIESRWELICHPKDDDAEAGQTRVTDSELVEAARAFCFCTRGCGSKGEIARDKIIEYELWEKLWKLFIARDATPHPLPEPEPEEERGRTPEEREAFDKQLKDASEEVTAWPKWKQEAVRKQLEIPKQPNYRAEPEPFVERITEVWWSGSQVFLPVAELGGPLSALSLEERTNMLVSEWADTLQKMGIGYRFETESPGKGMIITMECTAANRWTATEVK